MDDFRRFFFRGLAALLPTLITIALVLWAYRTVEANFGVHVTRAMMVLCASISAEPPASWLKETEDALRYGEPIDEWDQQGRRLTVEYKVLQQFARAMDPQNRAEFSTEEVAAAKKEKNRILWQVLFARYRLHLLGFAIAVIFVYFLGYFLASFVGKRAWAMAERLIGRVPLIRPVYANIKQVTDFLFSDRKVEFSGVVAVEYPRKGLWSVGLATGPPLDIIQRSAGVDMVTVFIPSSPTPITGYVITVPRTDIIELGMSIDEALRFTISGGVLKPGVTPAMG